MADPEAGAPAPDDDVPPAAAPPGAAAPEPVKLAAPASVGAPAVSPAHDRLAPVANPDSPGKKRLESAPGLVPAGSSPYDHLLRIRADGDTTTSIALFLGGLTAIIAIWALLTAGGPDVRSGKVTVGPDGRAPIGEALAARTEVWVQGWEQAEPGAEPGTETFQVERGSPGVLVFPKLAAGAEVEWGANLGSDPFVSAFLLPKPTEVLAGLIGLMKDAGVERRGDVEIETHARNFRAGLLSTLWRTTLGFVIAALICLPLGVLAGAYPPIKRIISPLEIAGGYAPPVALLPLCAALSGTLANSGVDPVWGENTARIAFLFVVTSFWLYPLVVKEIESIDGVFVNTAWMLGASRSQVILRVLVPMSSAKLWEHLRACYAIGWASIILAEGYASSKIQGEHGIGFFMTEMQRRHEMVNYFASVLAIIATGIVIDWLFRIAGRWLFPWAEART